MCMKLLFYFIFCENNETNFHIFASLQSKQASHAYSILLMFIHTNSGRTVKTNKMVIGIMVIQLIFVSFGAFDAMRIKLHLASLHFRDRLLDGEVNII